MRFWILILLSAGLLAGYQWVAAPEPDEPLTFTRVRPEPPQQETQAAEQPLWINTPGLYLEHMDGVTIQNNVFYGTGEKSRIYDNTIVSNQSLTLEARP